MIPCDSCRESSFEYQMSAWFKKYGYCVRRDIKYNTVEVFSSDFAKIEKKRSRINNKLRATRALLSENFIKINRLEKQQAFLKKREGEMIRRNIENIKALEKLKEEKRLLKEKTDANTVATSEPIRINSSSVSGDWVLSFFYCVILILRSKISLIKLLNQTLVLLKISNWFPNIVWNIVIFPFN